MRRLLFASLLLVSFAFSALPASARSKDEHVGVGNDINVAEGETAGDIACVFCRVHVHGEVKGDIAVAFGTVTVDAGRSVLGDVAGFGSDFYLGRDAEINGDVAVAAGDVKLAEGAAIHGDKAIAPSRIWLLLPLVPFLILAGFIWLIVSIVRRNRYRSPAYPQGRRF